MRSTDDRTTVARIRDAAITEFANNGVAGTSVRAIAAAADVSPGLVIHHFGSKDQLRVACDEHVAGIIREVKGDAMASGGALDVTAAFRAVGDVVRDAMSYVAIGVETGMVKPSEYEFERAAILTIWSLGALVLHEHLERLIGVDITADFSADPLATSAYMAPILEIYSQGVFTETTIEMLRAAFVETDPANEKEEA